MEDDAVFEALADPNRRRVLDVLFLQDGLTISEVDAHLKMTRFGTMKHLKVLEAAGLVSSQKVGRSRYIYLNAAPIRLLYERWADKFTDHLLADIASIKLRAEKSMNLKPDHIYYLFIQADAEAVWRSITDPARIKKYYFGSDFKGEFTPGSAYRYYNEAHGDYITGETVEVDPPKKLVMTFEIHWEANVSGVSRVTYLLEPEEKTTKLTIIHEGLDKHGEGADGVDEGWARILSGLKTLVESESGVLQSA